MARPTVIANWKMNGSIASNALLINSMADELGKVSDVDLGVCVPFPYLAQMQQVLKGGNLKLGAQNVNAEKSGAYTGEVSCEMLQEFNCHYVLVGHSERRALFGESDSALTKKFEAVVNANMVPVLCVGETLDQRKSGQTSAVVAAQINAVLSGVGITACRNAVIAYEPIWAIGTGETATPEQAQQVHAEIRQLLATESEEIAQAMPLLYGGSVNEVNASALFAQPDVDGGLVGGASLSAESFIEICQSAQR
jgi:triosephosphate isomerase